MRTAAKFDPLVTRAILDSACRTLGLDARSAELIRLGENALYRLADHGVVARVGRSVEVSTRELAVATWLATQEFPSNRPAAVSAPIVVDGFPVTFWELIDESSDPPTVEDLGELLRQLHSLPQTTIAPKLPAFEPMLKVPARLDTYGHLLTNRDLEFLTARAAEVGEAFAGLAFDLPAGPIHGDAHIGNLMRRRAGDVLMIDFGDAAVGPREWDVCVPAYGYEAFGWLGSAEYHRYVRAYGFDPLLWSGYSTLRAVRELNMTTWLLQLAGHSAGARRELDKRITDLRRGQSIRDWSAF